MYIVRKRNNRNESFDKMKIFNAVKMSIHDKVKSAQLEPDIHKLVDLVVEQIHKTYDSTNNEQIPVLAIHNFVEHFFIKMICSGHENTVTWQKAMGNYINYKVTKQSEYELSVKQLVEHLKSFNEYDGVSINVILKKIDQKIPSFDNMKSVNSMLIRILNDLTLEHYNYSFLAAEVLYDDIYREVEEALGVVSYDEYFKVAVANNLIQSDWDVRPYHCDSFQDTVLPKGQYTYLSLTTLYDRYLIRLNDKVIELPQWLWMRQSLIITKAQYINDDVAQQKLLYNDTLKKLSNFDFMPSTPTLFNAGTKRPQLSSCYVLTMEDSLDAIFKVISDISQLSKWAGGIGVDMTAIRSQGSKIQGTNGVSGGVIPFIKVVDVVALAVNQGGKRKGAVAIYLENWHWDVEEFIDLKKNTGDERRRAHDSHHALFITDLFMERVESDGDWTLFCPTTAPELHTSFGQTFKDKYESYEKTVDSNKKKTIKAIALWKKIVTATYETGHPWITWKCAMNNENNQKHVGMIHSSNLCTEIALNTSNGETAVCNLGSINLANHVLSDGSGIDWDKLQDTVKTAVLFLDTVIDLNFYPTKEAELSNKKHRPIGLGIMGFHDMLFKLNRSFKDALDENISHILMGHIFNSAARMSNKIAKKVGNYGSYDGSGWSQGIVQKYTKKFGEDVWDDADDITNLVKNGMRNSTLLAIAPTATISNIAGVSPAHEPFFCNIYTKNNLSGTFTVVHRHIVDYFNKNIKGGWTREIANSVLSNKGSVQHLLQNKKTKEMFATVWEIDQKMLVELAAKKGVWVDQGISHNIFMIGSSGKEISEIYMHAWRLGLKTTYYLRTTNKNEIATTMSCKKDAVDCDACQ